MDILAANAVQNFLSSAHFYLRFPPVTACAWDSTLACSQRELDVKRASGLLTLYSCLEQSLLRAVEGLRHPIDLKPICDLILCDGILARIFFRAGVCDSCTGRDSEQVSRAFLVVVEIIIVDRGVQGFMSWFSETFDPIVSVAVEACSECQPDPTADTTTSPTKREFPFHVVEDSKRRRTMSEVRRPISTRGVLRRLRQRQMLSTPENFASQINIVLNASPTVLDLVPEESPPRPTTPARQSWMSPSAVEDAGCTPSTAESESETFTAPPSGRTSTCDPTISMFSDSNWSPLGSPRALPVGFPYASSHPGAMDTSVIITKEIEDAAVFFISDTIEMVRRGDLSPTAIPPRTLAAPGKIDHPVVHERKRLKKKGKQVKPAGRKPTHPGVLLPVRHYNLPQRPARAPNHPKHKSFKSVATRAARSNTAN